MVVTVDATDRRPMKPALAGGSAGAPAEHWRWRISVTIAVLLHAAAIAGLLAATQVPPVAPAGSDDIEVSLIDPPDRPDDSPKPEALPDAQAPDKEPDPPPPAEVRPPTPPSEPPRPPIAEAAPAVSPEAARQPADVPTPAMPDVTADQPAPSPTEAPIPEAPPASRFGFAIPTGPADATNPTDPATPPPASVATRTTPPATAPTAPVARLAPLVITAAAGAPRDPRLPAYPADARARGEQGNVLVEVELDPGGAIRGTRLKTSSGHRSLDDAALNAARTLRFRAPRPPPGVVLHNTIMVEIPFSFRLN